MITAVGIAFSALAGALPPEALPQDATISPAQDVRTTPADSRSVLIPKSIHPGDIADLVTIGSPDTGVEIVDFRQREPGDGTPASQKTSAYLSYDEGNLYVVFVCQDDPDKVRGRMSKRDDIPDDDKVTVYLDTFHDGQHAYYFSVNPLGIQADGTISASGGDNRFDALWDAKGRITSDGYIVSIRIPFRSLRYSGTRSQVWGIALERSIIRNQESSFWPYITRRQSSFLQQFGTLEGLSDILKSLNLQLIPYGSYTNGRLFDRSRPGYRTQGDRRAGIDLKWAIKTSLSLDLTANPDFSQVESDDPQVTANQRYEVFFPEKRPFFLENVTKFETPLNLFFTRRIVDPEYGARLTGKVGRWDLGVLGSDDRAPGKSVSADNPVFGQRAYAGAVRLQREFLKDSNIGVLATERKFRSSENRIYSADTRLRLSPTWYFKGQGAYSDDRSYNSTFDLVRNSGRAYFGDLAYSGRNLSYGATYQDVSARFRAPLGFIQRVDTQKASQFFGYYSYPENSKILSLGSTLSGGATWDHSRHLTDKYSLVDFGMNFAGPVGFTISRYDAFESYLQHGYRYNTNSASFYVSAMKSFTFYGSFGLGSGINYAPPNAVAPFVGKVQNGSLSFTWRPTSRMRLEQFYYLSRFRAPEGATTLAGSERGIFINHLSRTKINFQFTKALSLREILDYNSLSPNEALYFGEHYKQLGSDLLLTYLLNPGTALYVGYNNRFENFAVDPEAPPQLRRFGGPRYPTTRQFYVKLSYLVHF